MSEKCSTWLAVNSFTTYLCIWPLFPHLIIYNIVLILIAPLNAIMLVSKNSLCFFYLIDMDFYSQLGEVGITLLSANLYVLVIQILDVALQLQTNQVIVNYFCNLLWKWLHWWNLFMIISVINMHAHLCFLWLYSHLIRCWVLGVVIILIGQLSILSLFLML